MMTRAKHKTCDIRTRSKALHCHSASRTDHMKLTLKLVFCSAAAAEASEAGSHAAVAACTTVWQPSSLGANKWLATHCMIGPALFQMLDLTAPGSTAHDCTSCHSLKLLYLCTA